MDRRIAVTLVIVTAGLAALPVPLPAQAPDAATALEIGDRVRIETTSRGTVVGTLRGRSSEGLLVLRDHRERFLPDSIIDGVEVSVGTAGSPGTGALVGAGIGAGLGLVVGGEEWVPVGEAAAGVALAPGGAAVRVRVPLGGG